MFERPLPPKLRPAPEPTGTRTAFQLLLLIALLGGAWYWFGGQLPAGLVPGPESDTTAPPKRKPNPLLSLQSTDGRLIEAEILVITDKSVFIRRGDGQTFDLPLERLSADSKKKIEHYRLGRIAEKK